MTLALYPNRIFGISPAMMKTPEYSTLTPESAAFIGPRISQTTNPKWHFQLAYEVLFNALTNPSTNYTRTELETLMGFFGSNSGQSGEFLLDDAEDDAAKGPVAVATVGSSAGSGFTAGDQLAVVDGGGLGAVLAVASTGGGGGITGFTVSNGGASYVSTTNAALQVLTGTGTGAPTANITAVETLQLIQDPTTLIWYSPLQRHLGSPEVGQLVEDITDLNPQDGSGLKVYANGALQTAGTNFTLAGPGLGSRATRSWASICTGPRRRPRPSRPVSDFIFGSALKWTRRTLNDSCTGSTPWAATTRSAAAEW